MVWIQQHHNAKLIGQIFNISHVLGWCSFMHKLISLSNILDYNKRIEGHLCICCCWLHIKLCSSWNSLSTKWESGWFMISLWIFRPWYAQMKNDGAMDKQLPICGRMVLQSWKISIDIISSLFKLSCFASEHCSSPQPSLQGPGSRSSWSFLLNPNLCKLHLGPIFEYSCSFV